MLSLLVHLQTDTPVGNLYLFPVVRTTIHIIGAMFLMCWCVGEVIFCIGSGLQCAARSLSELILGRAIGGFGVGALR